MFLSIFTPNFAYTAITIHYFSPVDRKLKRPIVFTQPPRCCFIFCERILLQMLHDFPSFLTVQYFSSLYWSGAGGALPNKPLCPSCYCYCLSQGECSARLCNLQLHNIHINFRNNLETHSEVQIWKPTRTHRRVSFYSVSLLFSLRK